jgi:hypothetical protein
MAADGTWNVNMNTPMGAQQVTLVLATSGDVVSGSIEGGPLGKVDISDGTISDDAPAWTVAVSQPTVMTLGFTGKVDGDEISGGVSLGSFGNATFSGKRAP